MHAATPTARKKRKTHAGCISLDIARGGAPPQGPRPSLVLDSGTLPGPDEKDVIQKECWAKTPTLTTEPAPEPARTLTAEPRRRPRVRPCSCFVTFACGPSCIRVVGRRPRGTHTSLSVAISGTSKLPTMQPAMVAQSGAVTEPLLPFWTPSPHSTSHTDGHPCHVAGCVYACNV